MMPKLYLSPLKKGIDLVRKATEEDGKKNYAEAYKLYNDSLDFFQMALKCKFCQRF